MSSSHCGAVGRSAEQRRSLQTQAAGNSAGSGASRKLAPAREGNRCRSIDVRRLSTALHSAIGCARGHGASPNRQLDISPSCRAFFRMILARFKRGKSLPSLGFPPLLLN